MTKLFIKSNVRRDYLAYARPHTLKFVFEKNEHKQKGPGLAHLTNILVSTSKLIAADELNFV